MNDREATAHALEQIEQELRLLHMGQVVQRSAYVLLARHLAAQGHIHLDTLTVDLKTMGKAQPDAGWKSGHEELADALALVQSLPSTRRR